MKNPLPVVTALLVGASFCPVVFAQDGCQPFTRRTLTLDERPNAIVAADVDADGSPDLLLVGSGDFTPFSSGNLCVLLGHGDGSFAAPATSFLGQTPDALSVADLDGDGTLDVAIADPQISSFAGLLDDTVYVLHGNGDGSFGPAVPNEVGNGADDVCAGDLDGDGVLDLVVPSTFTFPFGSLSLLFGQGNGSFAPFTTLGAGSGPIDVSLADLEADGDLDLVVSNNTSLEVLLGHGDGSFAAPVVYTVFANSVAIADLDGDGHLDLATATGSSAQVSVLPGAGDGSFGAATSYPAGPATGSIVSGDFDGDGDIDLAVTNVTADTVSLLPNRGDGSFLAPAAFAVGSGPTDLVAADLDGDGDLDLASADGIDNSVTLLLANVGPWCDLGLGLAGSQGEPRLYGTGPVQPLTPVALQLTQALPDASAFLVLSPATLFAPLKGGVLVPDPWNLAGILLTLAADAQGELLLADTWPAGVPLNVPLYFQFWIVDPGAPQGLSASNGLSVMQLP